MTLQVQHLSFERHFKYLLRHIHFELGGGELLQINGANGSGKSTFLRIIAGLIDIEEGKILWQGESIADKREHYQTQFNYLGHQNGVKLQLTVAENLAFFAALNNATSSEDAILLCKDIPRDTQAIHLSAGQKRRLALSRLLLNPKPLWILDEPTTALDHEGQQLFFDLLKKHLSQGGMAILTSHHELPAPLISKKIQLGEKHIA